MIGIEMEMGVLISIFALIAGVYAKVISEAKETARFRTRTEEQLKTLFKRFDEMEKSMAAFQVNIHNEHSEIVQRLSSLESKMDK